VINIIEELKKDFFFTLCVDGFQKHWLDMFMFVRLSDKWMDGK